MSPVSQTSRAVVSALLAGAVAVSASACSQLQDADDATPEYAVVDDLAAHGGRPCPATLPQGEGPDADFGTSVPATSLPDLPAVTPTFRAWVCRYDPVDAGPRYPDGGGTVYEWDRSGPARRVTTAQAEPLEAAVASLTIPEGGQACSEELGSRWMLVLATFDGDLTGFVAEDFGCRDVLMTDEPFSTPPGEAAQRGTVPGRLTGGRELVREMERAAAL